MYKFKASKYKNATATVAKKEECVTDFTVETPTTFGNHAAASAKLVAFCVGQPSGGKVMVLDVNAKGRLGSGPNLNAHSDAITSLDFSPFNHCRLATAGADNTVKIWDLPTEGIVEQYDEEPVHKLKGFPGRPECVAFSPVAENVLAVASKSTLYIYNLENGENVLELDVGCDLIQSISWKKSGDRIAVTSKDCRLLVCDPRQGKILTETKAHGNHKESRVLWLGETDKILTVGFSSSRTKELKIWNISGDNAQCMQTEEFGSGTGVLMPFYDEDTGMLFVAAKGDSNVAFLEFFEDKDPPLKIAKQELLQNQTKGMCSLPKLGVDAPEGEVNRLYQLAQKMLVPIPWKVPRRSLRDFPADLFPLTASDEPAMTSQQWIDGENKQRKKTSLEPGKRKPLSFVTNGAEVQTSSKEEPEIVEESKAKKPTVIKQVHAAETEPEVLKKVEEKSEPTKPKYKPFTGVRKSKFRHWKATVGHPSTHVTNIDSISLSISTTSDALRCSELYSATPIKGPGGQAAIIEHSKPGRMTSDNFLTLQNSKAICDLQWNPFDPKEIAIALENCSIKVWKIPKNKLGETLDDCELTYKEHDSRPVVLCYHPLAENIMASGDVEGRILIWNVSSGETYFNLSCGSGEVMSLAWSIDGRCLAASSKDKKLRIFEPRKTTDPIKIGPGPEGTRSSRLVWTCNDKFLAVSGFDSMSERKISLHSTSELASGPISCEDYSKSPAVMMMHYDEDSSTLFFVGKGDTTLNSLEISENEPPHLFRISTFSSDHPFQAFSFLPKKGIDPRKVEFAHAWFLAKTTLQPLSFTVPRVKMEYFQDDLFPPTSVTWEKTLSASDWMKGIDKLPSKLNLRPRGMKLLSEAPPDEVKPKKYESYDPSTYKSDEQKKEELLQAMSGKLDLDKDLEQDTMEGVDEDEWDDY